MKGVKTFAHGCIWKNLDEIFIFGRFSDIVYPYFGNFTE